MSQTASTNCLFNLAVASRFSINYVYPVTPLKYTRPTAFHWVLQSRWTNCRLILAVASRSSSTRAFTVAPVINIQLAAYHGVPQSRSTGCRLTLAVLCKLHRLCSSDSLRPRGVEVLLPLQHCPNLHLLITSCRAALATAGVGHGPIHGLLCLWRPGALA